MTSPSHHTLHRRLRIWKPLGYFAVTSMCCLLLLVLYAWALRPHGDDVAAQHRHTPDEIAQAQAVRRVELHPDHPPLIVQSVDYSEGTRGTWYPRGESPVLAELVMEGKLPPVAERVGPEPVVVEGTEGLGQYGGTWMGASADAADAFLMSYTYLSYPTLVRWSPEGYPLVPHLAKKWEITEGGRVYTFTLRKGLRWSDGEPFTVDDIIYFWQEEQLNTDIVPMPIPIMRVGGKLGRIEKVDNLTFRMVFDEPNGQLLEQLAGPWGLVVANSPAHYLRRYHPVYGDQKLIAREMRLRNLQTPLDVYYAVKAIDNPEHPRMFPWVYRSYRTSPPYTFVRNPYYYMVDTKGNQLPYIDQRMVQIKSADMLSLAAGTGELTMQFRDLRFSDYTYLMNQRKKYNFDVRCWYQADRSDWLIAPNLNRKVDPTRPWTAMQHELLNDKRFRQALSLAINRQAIIDAQYNGVTEPAQLAPGPSSFFYVPRAYTAFTEYDPARASQLLDALGLTRRDAEGFRTYPDGTRMSFVLPVAYANIGAGLGPAFFVRDDWQRVGIRLILREKSPALCEVERLSLEPSFTIAGISQVEHVPLLEPRFYLPMNGASSQAIAWAKWYSNGGFYGNKDADVPGAIPIPREHPYYRAAQIYDSVLKTTDHNEQRRLFSGILEIAAENLWTINICTPPPLLVVVKDGFRNVPRTAVSTWMFQAPGNTGIETYFFDRPTMSPGAHAQLLHELQHVTPMPQSVAGHENGAAKSASAGAPGQKLDRLGGFVITTLFLVLVVVVALMGIRHPFIGRRLLTMIPMLLTISVVSFIIIQLPPGDFLTVRMRQLEESGTAMDMAMVKQLREQFMLDRPMIVRYAHWMGLYWFTSFDTKDLGLLQGMLGRSMQNGQPVNSMIGDRLLLTVLISLATILLTWLISIPVGIYSAVRQYSRMDYLLSVLGFIGMCVPGFLLALVLIYLADAWFGLSVTGLYSPEYAVQPEWNWPKFIDLLKHIWLPVVVLAVGGTAGMIRVMRGNLLDELKKPYVTTAMAKGMRPMRLLLKYPVRLALNPFISGIGGLLPALISGSAIVEIVLSLPTIGPLMLNAFMSEDMYFAASMLMLLSLLSMLGTLISDLLLLWLDPRIRMQAGR
jgi:ABC-type dipeptide/oligopeptide/nickel transport system permease component/ABC-type transport system substrate-binding protein